MIKNKQSTFTGYRSSKKFRLLGRIGWYDQCIDVVAQVMHRFRRYRAPNVPAASHKGTGKYPTTNEMTCANLGRRIESKDNQGLGKRSGRDHCLLGDDGFQP